MPDKDQSDGRKTFAEKIMTTIVVFVVMASLLILFLRRGRDSSSSERVTKFPFFKKPSLLSPAEQAFLAVLEQSVKGRFRIFAQVRVADVLDIDKNISRSRWWSAFGRVSQKHFDFVVCDLKTFEVILAIELDDRSHNVSKKRENDEFKNAACAAANLPLLRQRARSSYDAKTLESQISALLLVEQQGFATYAER